MKSIVRGLAALAAAAVLSMTVVSCAGGSSTTASSAPADVKYKCACGKEKTVAAGATAPS